MGLFDLLKPRSLRDQFAQKVMRRLRERGWSQPLNYDAAGFTIETGSGALYLGNIFADWGTYPKSEQAAQLDRALNLLFENPEDEAFEDVADKLLPVVRNLTHMQVAALSSDSDPTVELWQPHQRLVGPLGVLIAIDCPTSVAFVSHRQLESWGCSFETVMARAMENLIAVSPVRFEQTEDGFYLADYGDTHDSSRVLMPELFPAIQVRGDPVAIVASRTCLMVAGSQETAALLAMANEALEVLETETRPTACFPIMLRNMTWEPFAPAEPALALLRDLATRQAFLDYNAQIPGLEAYLARKDLDLFVAPLEVLVAEDVPHSWTSWTQGVPVLLPRSEVLAMTTATERRLVRYWRDVESVCGTFVEDATLYPPRFTPPPWPSDAALHRLEEDFPEPPGWDLAEAETSMRQP